MKNLNVFKNTLLALAFVCPVVVSAGEMVIGFEMGGTLKNAGDHFSAVKMGGFSGRLYWKKAPKFFEKVGIVTDHKDKIQGLMFIKKYNVSINHLRVQSKTISGEYRNMIAILELKYGKFDNTQAKRILGNSGRKALYYYSEIKQASNNANPIIKGFGRVKLTLESDTESEELMIGGSSKLELKLVYLSPELSQAASTEEKKEYSGF